jgi:hypothetical protein
MAAAVIKEPMPVEERLKRKKAIKAQYGLLLPYVRNR